MSNLEKLIILTTKLANGDFEKIIEQALMDLEQQFIALQKDQWYNEGKDCNGVALGNYTSPSYAARRKKWGLRTDHVTLKFTGTFFGSLSLVQKSDGIYIESKGVDYEQYIVKRYGNDIYDLNDTERAKLIPMLTQIIINNLRVYLQL